MMAALVALVAFLQVVPPALVVDFFDPKDLSQASHGKILQTDDDPDVVRVQVGL